MVDMRTNAVGIVLIAPSPYSFSWGTLEGKQQKALLPKLFQARQARYRVQRIFK